MAAIPYSLGSEISKTLRFPQKFYWTAFEVLINSNGVQIFLNDNGFNPYFKTETVYFVLKHIIYRTLQFDKVFEFIRHKDVIKGVPTSAIAGCGLSETSVKRVLSWLSAPENNVLVKLKLKRNGKNIITPLYGLNLPRFLENVQGYWQDEISCFRRSKDDYEERPNRNPSNLYLRSQCQLQYCIEFSSQWKNAFDFLIEYSKPISDIEDFIENWSEHLPAKILDYPCRDFEDDLKYCNKINKLRKDYFDKLEGCKEY